MSSLISFREMDLSELRIPQNVSVNPQTGSASIEVGIPLTAGRSGVQPSLTLAYGSGGGNSAFGLGWNLVGLSSVQLSLKDGAPKYNGKDKYLFNGQELVPCIEESAGQQHQQYSETEQYWIRYFRSRLEADYSRVEQWIDKASRQIHWRVRNNQNQVFVFGRHPGGLSRIADANDSNRIYQWLLESFYDNRGNVIEYEYVSENADNVDAASIYERDRVVGVETFSQRYLKSIRYGNTVAAYPDEPPSADQHWLFEAVFDYGEHQNSGPSSFYNLSPSGWPARSDAFSSYIAGFEVRTYRLCRRVLMFHHFEELGEGPTPVGALNLEYREDDSGALLQQIEYTGYRRDAATDIYEQKSLPPLLYRYTDPEPEHAFRPAPAETMENLPVGIGGLNYKWVDLKGEGLSGILFESQASWYYKSNRGQGRFARQVRVASKPAAMTGTYGLSDFDGDGNLGLVVLQGREAGFFEYDRNEDDWVPFKTFRNSPHVRSFDNYTQLLDITGDGRADIVTVEQERIVYYPSLGKKGFDKPLEISKPRTNGRTRTPGIGANPGLDYFFADMTGDGRPDQVRVLNGRVEYWPNLGNGRFGGGVVMEASPVIECGFEFDAGRVRLVDLDGSGTSDLIYIGRGEIRYWINASGNKFVEGNVIRGLPYIDNFASAQVLDFLGNGTACLVWSMSGSSGQVQSLHYLQLTSGVKPCLMETVQNSMGLETRLSYGTSAEHYLRDLESGREWTTRLPNHVTVVNSIETIDLVGNTRFMQHFEYRDGFYDGEERSFRGFGLVDRYDSDVYRGAGSVPETEFTAPVCLRAWFHNGDTGWELKRTRNFYNGDELASPIPSYHFEDLNDLAHDEYKDAVRALAGRPIRTELYAINDEGERHPHPYRVSQTGYLIRRVQAGTAGHDPVIAVFVREELERIYEQTDGDPRTTHNFNIQIDAFGNPEKALQIAYRRRGAGTYEEQQKSHVVLQCVDFTNIDRDQRLELGIAYQQKTFELGFLPPPVTGETYTYSEAVEFADAALSRQRPHTVSFETEPDDSLPQARLMRWTQSFFWSDAGTGSLPLGDIGTVLLPHHSESACFNNEFIRDTLNHDEREPGESVEHYRPDLLAADSYYIFHDDYWWQPGAVTEYFGSNEFYLPRRERRPNSAYTEYIYDAAYHLLLTATADSTGNMESAEVDYHVIAPRRITDINDNISEVTYDPLGVPVVGTVQGRILDRSRTEQVYGHEHLDRYVPQSDVTFERILDDPQRFIQDAASYLYYDIENWAPLSSARGSLRSIQLARENWIHDGVGSTATSRISVSITYYDGLGRSLQNKLLVGPGEAIHINALGELEAVTVNESGQRWLVSGHAIYNNKQQVVRQYEPFYSTSAAFESDELLDRYGHSTLIVYDGTGREIERRFADDTLTRAEFTPWRMAQYDPNDAVDDSDYARRIDAIAGDHPEKTALAKARRHDNTPVTSHLDSLGRTFLTEEQNESGDYRRMRTKFDIQGSPLRIIDPRNLTAFAYQYDMLGRAFYEYSMDAGQKWMFVDALDQPMERWDQQGHRFISSFDTYGRITSLFVEGNGYANTIERYVYGESLPAAEGRQKNARGKMIAFYDQAGYVESERYDISGNLLAQSRRLLSDYKSTPDWPPHPDHADYTWIPGHFTSVRQYDALGRVTQEELPDQTVRHYRYHRDGNLERVGLTTGDGGWRDQAVLQSTGFNARGQRTRTVLGNDIRIDYHYSPLNYRMHNLHSFYRNPVTGETRNYQNLHYSYDPVGNLVQTVDLAQQAISDVIHNLGERGAARNEYTYDAFYQLISAEGRVHRSLLQYDYDPRAADTVRGTRRIGLNDGSQVERYRRDYRYDLSGNLLNINHVSDSRSWNNPVWTSATSNRSLPQQDLSGIDITYPESRFDQNGNCLYLPHLRSFKWNFKNQLERAVIVQRDDGTFDDAEYYVYGSDGQRLRKIREELVGGDGLIVTEKIYLDGCEIKRVTNRGVLNLERKTSHISDGTQRIAVLHQWSEGLGNGETDDTSEKKIHYQLNDHLGSAALELDQEYNVITYEEYFPFGGTAFIAGNEREVRLKDYRYTGKEQDDATGLYYFGYRYYAAWIGNWLSPDPLGPEDGLNLYRFTQNNPVNLVDPNGLQTTTRGIAVRVFGRSDFSRFEDAWVMMVDRHNFANDTHISAVPPSNASESHLLVRESGGQGDPSTMSPLPQSAHIPATATEVIYYDPTIAGHIADAGPEQRHQIASRLGLVYDEESGQFYAVFNAGEEAAAGAEEGAAGETQTGGSEGGADAGSVDAGDGNGGSNGGHGRSAGHGQQREEGEGSGGTGNAASGGSESGSRGHHGGSGETGGRGRTSGDPSSHGHGREIPPPGATTTDDPTRVQTDPRAQIDGDPNGSLTGTLGPEAVNTEEPRAGISNGGEHGTPCGIANAPEPEELELWQWALITLAVIAVSIITAGAMTMMLTSMAAVAGTVLATETLVGIGAVAGMTAGFAGDALTQGILIGAGAQMEFNEGQFLFAGGVGLATGGLGSYFAAGRTAVTAASTASRANSTGAMIRTGLTRFTAGAAEGGGEEMARQVIFEDEFNWGRVAESAAISGAVNVAVSSGIDLWQARRAARAPVANVEDSGQSGYGDTSSSVLAHTEAMQRIALIERMQEIVNESAAIADDAILRGDRAVLEQFLTPRETTRLLEGGSLASARRGVFIEWRSRLHFALDPQVQPHIGRGGYMGRRYVVGKGFRRGFADFFGTEGGLLSGMAVDITTRAGQAAHLARGYLEKGLLLIY